MATQTWTQIISDLFKTYPSAANAARGGNFLPLYGVFIQMNPDKCEEVPTWKASVRRTVAFLKTQKSSPKTSSEKRAAPKTPPVKGNVSVTPCHRVGCKKNGTMNGRCKEHCLDNLEAVENFKFKTVEAKDMLVRVVENCGKAAFKQAVVKVNKMLAANKIRLPKIYRTKKA